MDGFDLEPGADARSIPLVDETAQCVKPLCYDLFCGLGGWAEGFIAEGWNIIGFDIEAHDYGTGGYPSELRIRDVTTIHGSELADADAIVASPPCQAYSYRAMPWKKAKALPPPDNALFDACFRIQREACEAAGRYIPMVVENVCGAQKWVGRAKWHFGSYYLWGDVPALMPISGRSRKSQHIPLTETPKGTGKSSWFYGNSKHEGRYYGAKTGWSTSVQRKMASAMIAKIPFPLASYIARSVFIIAKRA